MGSSDFECVGSDGKPDSEFNHCTLPQEGALDKCGLRVAFPF